MTRIRAGAAVLAVIAIALGRAAWSEPVAQPQWNAQQVLGLAEQLVRALDETAAAAREAPPQATVMQQRTRDGAVTGLRETRQLAGDYLAKLRKGWDRDMTEAYLRSVKRKFSESRKLARDAVPTEEVEEKLRETDGILEQLSRYYPNA
jgi:hypothetical protein